MLQSAAMGRLGREPPRRDHGAGRLLSSAGKLLAQEPVVGVVSALAWAACPAVEGVSIARSRAGGGPQSPGPGNAPLVPKERLVFVIFLKSCRNSVEVN